MIEIPVDAVKLSPPLKKYVKRLVDNDVSVEEGALLTRYIAAHLLLNTPQRKKETIHKVVVSEQLTAMSESKIPEKFPALDNSYNNTAGFFKELSVTEQVTKQATEFVDWSRNHLFNTMSKEEALINDKLFEDDNFVMETRVAELNYGECKKIIATFLVSLDTTMVSNDTTLDETDTESRFQDLVSLDTIPCIDRQPHEDSLVLSEQATFLVDSLAASLRPVLQQKAPQPTHNTPREKQKYTLPGPSSS